jgi:hypothetical protein
LQSAKTVKVKTEKQAAVAKQDSLETSRLQKVIEDSVPMDDEVEDFNQILRENGIEI